MSLDYFTNRLNNMAILPNDILREMQQAVVDASWDNTTLSLTVKEEISHGSFVFTDINVWKNSISEFETNIVKDEKDFRRLMFKDQSHNVERGRYYKFEDNYWMVYNPTSVEEPYAEVFVRRCNNIAKWIDADTGILYEYPCVLGYDDMSPKQQESKVIITPNNSMTLTIQGNDNTIKLKENQRFIFNGRPFKVEGYNNYMQQDSETKRINLLVLNIYLDEKKPTDDFVNGIANGLEYNFNVTIQNDIEEGTKNSSGKLVAKVTKDNKVIDKTITWESVNGNGTITSSGIYTLVGDVGNTAKFVAKYGSYSDSIEISIVESVETETQIIVTPNITSINQGKSIILTPKVFINGVETSNTVTATLSGADSRCYTFVVNEITGTFTLTNNLRSVDDLIITWRYNDSTFAQTIKLNAMF